MRIWREGYPDGVVVNPGATLQLQHDDRVDIISGLPLTCVCCSLSVARKPIDSNSTACNGKRYAASKHLGKSEPQFPSTAERLLVRQITLLRVCGQLTPSRMGVYVVRTMHPDITHHIVPSHALSPPHMTSLLSAAHLVKPEWLSELLDLYLLDTRESPRALEHTFALPHKGRFRTGFAPLDSQKQSTYLLSCCERSPCNTVLCSGETPLPDIVPNYFVLLQRGFSAFAAYWKSGASGSQKPFRVAGHHASGATPSAQKVQAALKDITSDGGSGLRRKARTIAAEAADESIDLVIGEVPDDETDECKEPHAAKPPPRSIRNKAGAIAPPYPTKPKKLA